MKKVKIVITGIISILIFTSCAGIISFRNPKISRKDIKKQKEMYKNLKPVLFEDFEKGTLVGAYSYANKDGGASATYTIGGENEGPPHSGKYCAKAMYDSGISSEWGCGFGAQSSYGNGYIDATGRKYISLWVKAPANTTFYVFCNEANANGGDGEFWNSPDQTASGEWTEYKIPFDEFHRNIYSGNQAGNLTLDTSAIAVVGIQIGGAQGKGIMYIDDIWFK